MGEYSGFLVSHVPQIRHLAGMGNKPKAIAEILIAEGVRSPYAYGHDPLPAMTAMVSYVLRGGNKKKPKARWQTWTPEMQEAEFQREYAA